MTAVPDGPGRPRVRRRRWPRRLVVSLVVLAALLVAADRISVAVAERVTADRIEVRAPFSRRPAVHVHGFPFLTQVAGGRYQDIEVSGGGLHLGQVSGATLDADLRGVHLAASDVLGGHVGSLPVDHVDGTVTLPYDQLAALTDVPTLTLRRSGTSVLGSATLSVPYTDLRVTVSGAASFSVADGTAHVRVTALSVAGRSLPSAVLSVLAGRLAAIPIDLPDLPYGLRIDSIRPTDSGVAIGAAATGVVLHASS